MIFPLKDINPTERFPIVTIGLIVANAIVYLYELSLGPHIQAFITSWGTVPYEITHGVDLVGRDPSAPIVHTRTPTIHYVTLFSSMFIHGGVFHLLGNMLYLWIFGNNIEDLLGPVRFVVFYLVCGLIASFTHILMQPDSTIPTVGASGAVSGVLGAYLITYPHARVLTLIFVVFFVRLMLVPAGVLLAFWFIFNALSGFASLGLRGGGVAWFAHVGGFLAGIILLKAMTVSGLAKRRRETATSDE
jgi:membrane associated rhomboid family serine protease